MRRGLAPAILAAALLALTAIGGIGAWLGTLLGTPPSTLDRAADDALRDAVTALEAPGAPPAVTLAAYARHLRDAEGLLARSLATNPAQPRTLARLAAVRWELDASAAGSEARIGEMIATASSMAPDVPDVQARLGTLLLRMGRRDDAAPYLRRAVELSPGSASAVVAQMRTLGVDSRTIARTLSGIPEAIAALYVPFFEDGRGAEYLDLAEPALAGGFETIAPPFAAACLRTGSAARLRAALARRGPLADSEVEALRLVHLARAKLALGEKDDAASDARRARVLAPGSIPVSEIASQVAAGAGRPDEAIEGLRAALDLLAERDGSASHRASVWVQIGLAEEARGRPDRAYDDYAKALALDPGRKDAADRIDRIRRATGLAHPPVAMPTP